MYRYISLNLNSNPNSLNINKKQQKTTPISLLSGGNSFFVKIKSNQIATNYIDKNIKIKSNPYPKINNTYFVKESKDKLLNRYLNNSQPKVSFHFNINSSLEQRKTKVNSKSLINKTKPEILTHNKGIYSFTSIRYNGKLNNNSINSTSNRKNYNEVLLTDLDHLKVNMNKISTIQEKSKEDKKIINEKNDKNIYSNNTFDYRNNQKSKLNPKIKINNKLSIEPKKKLKTIPEKNTILTNKNKNNHQIKLIRKNQYTTNNNNKKIIRYKNISNILFNTNSNIDKNKHKNNDKNNNSEGKNRVIFNGNKRNSKLISNDNSNINEGNNTNIFKDHIKETDEFDSDLSKRKAEKKIKSINVNPNNEELRIKNNNKLKYNFNTTIIDKSLLFQKKNQESINNNNPQIITKSINNINKNPKLDNSLQEKKPNFNHNLTDLTGLNSKNVIKQGNVNLINENIDSIKKVIEINNQKDPKRRNKNKLLGLNSFNIDKNKVYNNYPNKIISNNYLHNNIPFVTLNNSIDNQNVNTNRLELNKNSFFENDVHVNISQNLQMDKLLNYNTIPDNIINKEFKDKNNKKYKNVQEHIKININNSNNINYSINQINNTYNFHTKFISSNALENNINKSKINGINFYFHKENANNNIVDNYVSKEKNKKRKQNPPLNKIPKKLNILSIIQENNKKLKINNIRRKPNLYNALDNNNKSNNINDKNEYITIENILYPENVNLNDSTDMFDNFDDMNTIVKRINFENIDLKKENIFTVENKNNGKNNYINYWYEKYSESFNNLFDKKFAYNKQNMSAAQKKIKKTNYIYHSRQSGSTKASNKENSSIKKIRVSSYIDKKLDKNSC